MKIKLVSVGTRMPDWVDRAVEEYRRRLPPDFALQCHAVPMARRSRNTGAGQAREQEGQALLGKLDRRDHVVALDVGGRHHSTEELARRVQAIREDGCDLSLLVGGPDGLSPQCLQRAGERWSLSALTLAHPLVRVVVAEQFYRIWSLLHGHPYHRG